MVQWYNVVAIIVILILLYLSLKNNSDGGGHGDYSFDMSWIINAFWILILIIFVALWGGIFWW
jgi:hypothetical protein